MSSLILVPLCLAFWGFTLLRLRKIRWEEARKGEGTALDIWAIVFFGSLDLTVMITEVAAFLDAHTFPNLSLLVGHGSFLAGIYFLTVVSLAAIGAPSARRTIRLLKLLLGLALSALLLLYILFLSKMTPLQLFESRNFPEVIFKLITMSFGIMLSMILVGTYLAHLPAKEFALMRLRAQAIVLCAASAAAYLLVNSIVILASYFWPFFSSPWLFTLATLFLVCGALAFFAALLGEKLYARFVIESSRLAYWRAFQDLQYLVERMLQLFPPVNLPPTKPGFRQFLLDPEYHLYRAVIIIMDCSSMLTGFLAELGDAPRKLEEWEIEEGDDLVGEAQEVNRALQSVNLPDDFFEVVEAYRRASQTLARESKYTRAGAGIPD